MEINKVNTLENIKEDKLEIIQKNEKNSINIINTETKEKENGKEEIQFNNNNFNSKLNTSEINEQRSYPLLFK